MIHQSKKLPDILAGNAYPGRGLMLGHSPDMKAAVLVYFIMGRSQSSRNRVFEQEGQELRIRIPGGPVGDSSLILYRPSARVGRQIILSNGDQTDSIQQALESGGSFEAALRGRHFEPDAPHFTPRISGLLHLDLGEEAAIHLSILKTADKVGSACIRHFFEYPALAGNGHFIHTYQGDESPLPSFTGEPIRVEVPADAASFARELWQSLNPHNRVALCLRSIDLSSQEEHFYIFNSHRAEGEQHG